MLTGQSQLKKKPLEALKTAEKLMRIDPLNMSFVNFLSQAAVAAQMPEVAIQTMEIAKEHFPKDTALLKSLSQLYIEGNQPAEARACLETLTQLLPNDPKIIKALKDAAALDTMKKGKWDDASSFRDIIKDSKEAVLLEQEAKAVKSGKDLDALIEETRQKVNREPENINYRRALADYLSRDNRFDEALDVLKEAQEATGRADPQVERAVSAIQVKKFDAHIGALRQAGREDEARAKEQEKETFLIEDAADRVRRYPNDLQFRFDYGLLLYERNRLDEAIEELQMAQRNPQRRIRALYYLALSFKQKKQYDIALEQLQKATSELTIMDETKKDIVYEMGILSEAMGNLEKAAVYFKEIYAVDIRFKDVSAKIEKAYKK